MSIAAVLGVVRLHLRRRRGVRRDGGDGRGVAHRDMVHRPEENRSPGRARLAGKAGGAAASSWSTLATSKPLLVMAARCCCFIWARRDAAAAGPGLVAGGAGDPAPSPGDRGGGAAHHGADGDRRRGSPRRAATGSCSCWRCWPCPCRGVIAAVVTGPIGLVPVQMLDGLGAGLLGVARRWSRTHPGRHRVTSMPGLGAVMTMQGVGAALSPALGGYVAESAPAMASSCARRRVAGRVVLWARDPSR